MCRSESNCSEANKAVGNFWLFWGTICEVGTIFAVGVGGGEHTVHGGHHIALSAREVTMHARWGIHKIFSVLCLII